MSAYPELPFVLIGDSGQEDARLYAQAATENPEQVMAIFIRDVDPDVDSPADQIVHASIAIANSVEVAELALPLELISEEWLTRIIEDTRADFDLPEAPLPS